MWTDSHCHLSMDGLGDDAVAAAKEAGVTRMVAIGTDAASSQEAVAAAHRHREVYATVGLHPHEASHGTEGVAVLLDDRDPKVVGVGECGLDYYYEHSPRDVQREAFAEQIGMARQLDLTLVVHTRDAWDETFEIVDAERVPDRWIVHCFTGGPGEARKALDRGAYLSFSGIVTFKNATDIQAAAKLCPLDRMLVETDSPFLAPVPNRGKPNQPAWVPLVGEAIAGLKGVAMEEIARATWDAATAAFRLA